MPSKTTSTGIPTRILEHLGYTALTLLGLALYAAVKALAGGTYVAFAGTEKASGES